MAYTFIDHGSWSLYTPAAEQRGSAPLGAMFCKRDADDVDWYAIARDSSAWGEDTIKLTANMANGKLTSQAVVTDQQRLFPAGCQVFEISGYTGTDPQADLGFCVIDLEANTFTPVMHPLAALIAKGDIWRRATDEEAEAIVAALGQQSVRKQRLFNDSQYIDPEDPEFADLKAAFVTAFGADRAGQLLAPSSGS